MSLPFDEIPFDDDVSWHEDEQGDEEEDVSPEIVISRIETLVFGIVRQLDEGKVPVLEGNGITKDFGQWNQCRSFTNIVLVLSYCHILLLANRTTTTREVFYFYVTHFRSHKVSANVSNNRTNTISASVTSLTLIFLFHKFFRLPTGMLCRHMGCCRALGGPSSCLGIACVAAGMVDRRLAISARRIVCHGWTIHAVHSGCHHWE